MLRIRASAELLSLVVLVFLLPDGARAQSVIDCSRATTVNCSRATTRDQYNRCVQQNEQACRDYRRDQILKYSQRGAQIIDKGIGYAARKNVPYGGAAYGIGRAIGNQGYEYWQNNEPRRWKRRNGQQPQSYESLRSQQRSYWSINPQK